MTEKKHAISISTIMKVTKSLLLLALVTLAASQVIGALESCPLASLHNMVCTSIIQVKVLPIKQYTG